MNTKAVAYLRVSTEQQATEGVSLAAQRKRIEAYCEASGLALGCVFSDEGISGSRASNRPGLDAALKATCASKGVLVVYSLSRLARSTRDTLEIAARLEKCGADLCSLSEKIDTTSASGKMVFRLLAVLAEFERDQTAERTRFALRFKRERGQRWCNDPPYGYRWRGNALQEHPAEQRVIRRAAKLRRDGLTIRDVAACLRALGIRNRRGRPFPYQRIATILQRHCADRLRRRPVRACQARLF